MCPAKVSSCSTVETCLHSQHQFISQGLWRSKTGKKTGRELACIYAQTTMGGEVWYPGMTATDHIGLCLCVQAEFILLFAPSSLLGTQDQAGLPQWKKLHLHTPKMRLYLFLKISLNLFKLITKIQIFETALFLLPVLLRQSEIQR